MVEGRAARKAVGEHPPLESSSAAGGIPRLSMAAHLFLCESFRKSPIDRMVSSPYLVCSGFLTTEG
jgi:hypothetical protein